MESGNTPEGETTAPSTVKAALDEAIATLSGERASEDARYLMSALLGVGTASLATHLDDLLDASVRERFGEWIARRRAGEPLQHIVGTAPFRHLEVEVTPDVLIPRPETEVLADLAIEDLREMHAIMAASGSVRPLRVLDLGCGSGCIALAIATEAEEAGYAPVEVIATDISASALAVAARNIERYGAEDSVRLLEGDLYDALDAEAAEDAFDLIVSNPPYVPDAVMEQLPAEVADHEPVQALAGGADGLDVYRRILAGIRGHLASGGSFVCELFEENLQTAAALARTLFIRVTTAPDLTGRERFLHASSLWSATPTLPVDPTDPDENDIALASTALLFGQPLIFPTDTVYGIGVAVLPNATPQRIYDLKVREADKPIAWLVGPGEDGDLTAALSFYGADVPPYAYELAGAFWPGALTLVVKASGEVPPAFASPAGTVALRMPDHAVPLALIAAVGTPLATSSANRSGENPACTADEIDACLIQQVPMTLNAGRTDVQIASAVVDCTGTLPNILRQGSISEEAIHGVCEKVY